MYHFLEQVGYRVMRYWGGPDLLANCNTPEEYWQLFSKEQEGALEK